MSEADNRTRGWLYRNLSWSNSRQSWEERAGLAAIFTVSALLFWFHSRLPALVEIAAWAVVTVVSIALLRRGWLKIFGPVLFYDLVRIARKARYFGLRIFYVVLMAAVLGWVYLIWSPRLAQLATRDMTNFAESFFYTFMFIQFVVIAVLTPAYTAGAIAEEKERKTLEYILATDLRNREIVLSKLASRIANLTLLVLAGLPILSFLQFMGGIDPNLLLAGFAATGLTMASLGAFSILNSVVAKKTRDAIALSYLGSVAYLCLSGLSWLLVSMPGVAAFPSTANWTSPITVADLVHWFNAGNPISALFLLTQAVEQGRMIAAVLPGLLQAYAFFHGLVLALCTSWSIWRIRAIAIAQAHAETRKRSRRLWGFRRPAIGSYPMIWKEVFAESGLRFYALGRVFLVLLVAASFVPVGIAYYFYFTDYSVSGSGTQHSETMNMWVRIVGTIVACLLLLGVAARAAGSLSGERDRQTLDGLLASPLTSDTILFAKWLGNILSIRWGWLWLGLIYLFGLATQGLHPLAVVLLVLAWFIYAAVVSGIGLWFSISSKTTLRATIWSFLVTTAAGVGHWFLWMCCMPFAIAGGASFGAGEYLMKLQAGLTPPLAMGYSFSFSPRNLTETSWRSSFFELFPFSMAGLAIWVVVALALWAMTSVRFKEVFQREPVRPVRHRDRCPR